MSLKKHVDAVLPGFGKPHFCFALTQLQVALLSGPSFTGSDLERGAREVESGFTFMAKDRPMTSDAYTWFWGLTFLCEEGVVKVLIPWSQDWTEQDNSPTDRAFAVYKNPKVSDSRVSALLTDLTTIYFRIAAEKEQALAQ